MPKENTAPLERSTPEAEGVPSGAIERFYKTIEAQADTTACHAITILRHGKVIAEGAYAPYRLEIPHMLYSMSKSVTGLAVGIACDEGYLDINERLVEISRSTLPIQTRKYSRRIRSGTCLRCPQA